MDAPGYMQIEEEFNQLLELYRERKPKKILEIGIADGGTLWKWAELAPNFAEIFAIDQADLPREVIKEIRKRFPVTLRVIRNDSTHPHTVEWAKEYAPFDWLFIDGSHRLDHVTQDWIYYGKMVRPGGVVAFHDIAVHRDPHYSDVGILWNQIKNDYEHKEFINDPDQGWGGTGVIFK